MTELASSAPIVLIVEDEEDIRSMLRVFFEQEGFTAFEAGDPATAYDLFVAHRPHLFVSDILLRSDETGLDLNERIADWARDARHDYISIAITAASKLEGQEADRATAVSSFDHHLPKPLNFDDLLRIIDDEFGKVA